MQHAEMDTIPLGKDTIDNRLHTGLKTGMRAALRAIPALFLLVLNPHPARADSPNISVAIDKQSVTVGDPITYTLTVQYDSTLKLIAPVVGKTLGKLQVLADSTVAAQPTTPGQKTYRRQLHLAAFETGSLWIAAVHGETVDSAGHSTPWQSDSVLISVSSVLASAGTDTTDIHGLKGPYVAPEFHWLLWTVAIIVLVGAAIYFWQRRRRLAAIAAPPAPPAPAWETALGSLRTMRAEIDPESDGGRLWYFRLSEILRRYFDQRYGWDSIEETTTEVMHRLESAPFDSGHQQRAQEFFQLADRVRYARHPAKVGRPEVDWEWVREFVQSTIPVISTVPTPDDAGRSQESESAPPEDRHLDVTA
jgi:hypothetical protein